jgi:hypothetical protein
MSAATSHEVGPSICKILGLNPKDVSRLVIDFKANDVVRVTVERLVHTFEIEELGAVLEKYTLERVEDGHEQT